MLTRKDAIERVKNGATFLDGEWPEWFNHVDVNTLDMAFDCNCVLGQLDGSYKKATRKLWPEPLVIRAAKYLTRRESLGYTTGVQLGFDVPHSKLKSQRDADFALIQDAWVAQITSRRCRTERPLATNAVDPVGETDAVGVWRAASP